MALPTLTPEQREQALAKAAHARRRRGELKLDLSNGKITLRSLLEGEYGDYAADAEVVRKTRMDQLLRAVPRVGAVKAEAIMQQAGIADNRRLAGIGQEQRRRLIELLKEHDGEE